MHAGERTERRSGREWSVRRVGPLLSSIQQSIPAKAINSAVWGGSLKRYLSGVEAGLHLRSNSSH